MQESELVYHRDAYLFKFACVFALYATRDMNNVVGAVDAEATDENVKY